MSANLLSAHAAAASSLFDQPAFDQLLQQLASEFAATAAEHDRDGSFPHQNFERLHQHGLLSLTVPHFAGGHAATLAQTRRVIGAVAYGDPSTALVLSMQYLQHAANSRTARWPTQLYRQVATEAVRDGALINALRVEPELGTPARGGLPATVARRVPQGWCISGRKIYSTGIPRLTWLNVWARSDDAQPLVGSWLVHRDTPGVSVVENWDHLGMRATGSHEVIFDDVLVPAEHAVDVAPANSQPDIDPTTLLWSAVLLGAIYDGVARAARDWLVDWLQNRVPANLGTPLASLPRFQEAVGQIDAWLLSNRLLLDAAAANTRVASDDSGRIKYLVTTQAIAVVEKAIEISGNPGLSRNNALERHYRNVLCSRIHTPQNDSILINAGRIALLGPQTGSLVAPAQTSPVRVA
ncbi:alkylation response protein AidB-like acyl-CoA dehydrogenase [Herbaspirillum sp. Sphag1AN]|uniref:acyl-CoA dehydrogenase family protein n=1 Tax=unclassified Herbaspirillum TaxID=2624150 RepID=UPI0016146B61|nr:MULTISPECIES: acyl-CoA dehydrogenase family protein [unclassified Herbaspirillum]MBB3213458.1 alkylation response protein AidB-like acyl-CoA dehydrogenase [Herbaspirillum sp. Sphag1AN]MBB3246498.1 alkylation response protein AidB-like acyl-CoA dehydrogenase [Herbaspirillum sp. Sphag64]